jgi:uncharacterized protein YjgD (DUF1641 family)
VNKESLLVILMEKVALLEHCRVLDGLTNNTADCIIINIAKETSNNELTLGLTETGESR